MVTPLVLCEGQDKSIEKWGVQAEFCRGCAIAGSALKKYKWPPKNMSDGPPSASKIRAMHRRYEDYLGRIHRRSV